MLQFSGFVLFVDTVYFLLYYTTLHYYYKYIKIIKQYIKYINSRI